MITAQGMINLYSIPKKIDEKETHREKETQKKRQ